MKQLGEGEKLQIRKGLDTVGLGIQRAEANPADAKSHLDRARKRIKDIAKDIENLNVNYFNYADTALEEKEYQQFLTTAKRELQARKDDIDRVQALAVPSYFDDEYGGGTGATGSRGPRNNEQDQALEMINYGRQVQLDDIQILERNLKKTGGIKEMGKEILIEQDKQMNQLDEIEGEVDMTQGTMKRLQGYLTYFGKAYCRDALILCLIITIVLAIIGIIIASAV